VVSCMTGGKVRLLTLEDVKTIEESLEVARTANGA
jgi:hypothetical protein